MSDRTHNVLFLCTGNSARSILAEVLIEHWELLPWNWQPLDATRAAA